ncbi:MAG: YihY/virulence factor BrkB family protein [candidate division Zixibacteria bacterium]|nr:YihY/virulence factor BrkB family protein [candidate division Zixibacteria bacterium]
MSRLPLPSRKSIARFFGHYLGGLWSAAEKRHLFLLSGGLTFWIFLSVIPFALILYWIVGLIVQSGDVQASIDAYVDALIPYSEYAGWAKNFIFARVVELEAYKGIAGYAGSIGLLITASGLFSAMRTVLDSVFEVRTDMHFALHRLRDLGMALVVAVFFLLSIAVLPAFEIIEELTTDVNLAGDYPGALIVETFVSVLGNVLFYLFSLTVMAGVFYVLYRFVPTSLTDRRTALVSALCATALWEIAKQLFGFYITNFATLQKIYGAYILLVVVSLWMYYTSVIFIVGAEIGQLYRESHKGAWTKFKDRWRRIRNA